MNSDDLAFFSLVARAGSLSAAALETGMDASTVSRRIGQLEKSLATRLFVRSGRGMTTTAQGELLLDHARRIGALMAEARAAMDRPSSGPAAVHIAAQPTIARVMFGRLYHAIKRRYPATRIHFTEGLADRVLAGLHAGEVDIALLYRPEHPGGLADEPLLMERLCLLTPADSDVTAERLRAHGLADVPLVLPSTRHGMRVLVEAMAARRQQVPHIVLESDSSIALTVELVRQRVGCTVLPWAAAQAELAAGSLRALPLDGPDGERCVALVMGRTQTAAADLWSLNGLIRDLAADMLRHGDWPGARAVQPA